MKKLIQLNVLVLALFVLFSCNSGPNLSGKWEGENITLTITKEGDNYFINSNNPRGMVNGNYSGKYENGVIKIGQSFLGDITYSKENDKLFFAGDEFTRTK